MRAIDGPCGHHFEAETDAAELITEPGTRS